MEVTDAKLKEIYIMMKKCRAHEEKAIDEFRKGNIPGFIHSGIGQEAIPVAVCALLEKDDYVFPSHRGHMALIARGASLDRFWAEICAREEGYLGGVGGALHPAFLEGNIPMLIGTLGTQITLASGVALAFRMKGLRQVVACFFGDGTTCVGAFHEGVGFAAAFDLPVVFICENNQYEESTPWTYWGKRLENLAQRAQGYGIPGVSVDGNDAEAVAQAASEAIERARQGEGPTLIEAVTYRIYGHHMGDPGTAYRSVEEIEEWKKRDPIDRLYSRLLKAGLVTETENKEIEAKLAQELDEAVRLALNSPLMKPEESLRNKVYYGREINLSKVWEG